MSPSWRSVLGSVSGRLRGPRHLRVEPGVLPDAPEACAAAITAALEHALSAREPAPAQAVTIGASTGLLASGPVAARASVIVSNRNARYALLPWRAGLSGDAEWTVLARHAFATTHGAAARQWDVRVARASGRVARVACAFDAHLVPALRSACAARGVVLDSVVPHFVDAFNRSHRLLDGVPRGAWFADCGSGRMVLGLVRNGEWASLHTRRIGEDAGMRIMDTVLRDTALLGADEVHTLVLHGDAGLALPDAPAGWAVIDTRSAQPRGALRIGSPFRQTSRAGGHAQPPGRPAERPAEMQP